MSTEPTNPVELTVDHLASDIRQLAFEVNNVAITVSALIEVLSIDKEKLKSTAQIILERAMGGAKENEGSEEADSNNKSEDLTKENIEAGGDSAHPENATIFGDLPG